MAIFKTLHSLRLQIGSYATLGSLMRVFRGSRINCWWLVIHQGRHPGDHARHLHLCLHNVTSHLLKISTCKRSLVNAQQSCVASITGHPRVVHPFWVDSGTWNFQLFMRHTREQDASVRGKRWDGSSQVGKGSLERSTIVNQACGWLWRHKEPSASPCKLRDSICTHKHWGRQTREWLFPSGTQPPVQSAICTSWAGLLSDSVRDDIMHIPWGCIIPCLLPAIMGKPPESFGSTKSTPKLGGDGEPGVCRSTQARPDYFLGDVMSSCVSGSLQSLGHGAEEDTSPTTPLLQSSSLPHPHGIPDRSTDDGISFLPNT